MTVGSPTAGSTIKNTQQGVKSLREEDTHNVFLKGEMTLRRVRSPKETVRENGQRLLLLFRAVRGVEVITQIGRADWGQAYVTSAGYQGMYQEIANKERVRMRADCGSKIEVISIIKLKW